MKITPETVVLINCGCEGIQKLARAVRSQKVYTMVIPYSASAERVSAEKPAGLILVADGNADLLNEAKQKFAVCGVPLLVITDPDQSVQTAVDFCFNECFKMFPSLKIDTHKDNIPMQKVLLRNGFKFCGIIHLENGDERLAYQKI